MNRARAFTLVELLVVLAIVGILVSLALPAIQAAREASRKAQCCNNLKQVGIALQAYHDALRTLPSGYIFDPYAPVTTTGSSVGSGLGPTGMLRFDAPPPPSGVIFPQSPGWGWAALLLPYMEQASLSDQIDFGLAVEASRMASVRTHGLHYLTCPSDAETGVFPIFDELNAPLCHAATNSYVACFGAYGLINTDPDVGNGLFQRNSHIRFAQIADGLSQTVAVGERPALFAKAPWAGVITTGTVRTTPGAPVYTAVVELAPTMANRPGCQSSARQSLQRAVRFLFTAQGPRLLCAGRWIRAGIDRRPGLGRVSRPGHPSRRRLTGIAAGGRV